MIVVLFYSNNICEKITRFWLAETVQLKSNTSAKSVKPVQKA